MLLTEYIQKRLREEAEEGAASPEEIIEKLREDYPTMMKYYEQNRSKFPSNIRKAVARFAKARRMGKDSESVDTPSYSETPSNTPYHNLLNDAIRYIVPHTMQGRKGKEVPTLTKLIYYEDRQPSWPLSEVNKTKLENIENLLQKFEGGDLPDKEEIKEWKSDMEIKYPNMAWFVLNKQMYKEQAEKIKEKGYKDPRQYLFAKIATTSHLHGTDMPDDISGSVDAYEDAIRYGPFTLTRPQKEYIQEMEYVLDALFKGFDNLEQYVKNIEAGPEQEEAEKYLYDEEEDKYKGFNPVTKSGGNDRESATDLHKQPRSEKRKEAVYNDKKTVDNEFIRLTNIFASKHKGAMPEVYKKDFDKFYEHIQAIDSYDAYKEEYGSRARKESRDPLFIHLDKKMEKYVEKRLKEFWENNIKTQE